MKLLQTTQTMVWFPPVFFKRYVFITSTMLIRIHASTYIWCSQLYKKMNSYDHGKIVIADMGMIRQFNEYSTFCSCHYSHCSYFNKYSLFYRKRAFLWSSDYVSVYENRGSIFERRIELCNHVKYHITAVLHNLLLWTAQHTSSTVWSIILCWIKKLRVH